MLQGLFQPPELPPAKAAEEDGVLKMKPYSLHEVTDLLQPSFVGDVVTYEIVRLHRSAS